MDYSIFPYWMSISNFGELIIATFCIICLFLPLYCLFGYTFCPNSLKAQWIRTLYIIFWPIIILLMILSLPFIMIYEFSKTPKTSESK